jgi:hypothetical protein
MQLKLITAITVLLLVVASLSVSGCTTSRNEQTIQSSSSNIPTGDQNTPTVSVTATYLGSANSLTSSYGTVTAAAPGNKFVKYAIYCQNINAKDMDMGNPNYLKLRDTQSNIYPYDWSSASMQQQVGGKTLTGITYETTQPGDKVSGLIAFQLPIDATPKSLTYDDYTNRITINL